MCVCRCLCCTNKWSREIKTMHMCMNMHWNFIYYHWKVGTIQMPINREWLNHVYPYNEYYSALKNIKYVLWKIATICVNLKKFCLVKAVRPKAYMLYDSIYINSSIWKIIFGVRKVIRHCLGWAWCTRKLISYHDNCFLGVYIF